MLVIQNELLQSANMNEQELLEEIAIMLYEKGRLSFGIAAKMANKDYSAFQLLLGANNINVNYGVNELLEDIETIEKMNLSNGNC